MSLELAVFCEIEKTTYLDIISKMSKAVGSSGVERDFLWLCSFEICIHFPLKNE